TPHILEQLCRVTTEVLQCDASYTFLWSPKDDAFIPLAGYGDTQEQWEIFRTFSISRQGMNDLLARLEQETVTQVDLTTRHNLSPGLLGALQFGASVSLCMALRRGGELIGVQAAGYRHRPAVFSPTSERIALGIAQIASLALNNARLLEEVEAVN